MKTRHVNITSFLLFTFFLCLLAVSAMTEQRRGLANVFLALLLVILFLASAKMYNFMEGEAPVIKDNWRKMASLILGAFLTFFLNTRLKFGPVLSASLVGIGGAFLPGILKLSDDPEYAAFIYCGAFIGMSSAVVFPNMYLLALAAVTSAFLFVVSKNVYLGIGGKLGTIAFMGVSSAVVLLRVIK